MEVDVTAPRPLRLADEVFKALPESQLPPWHTVQIVEGGPPTIQTLDGLLNTLNEAQFTSKPFGRHGYYVNRGEGFVESFLNPESAAYDQQNRRPQPLAYTEEQKCLYWAYMASTIFWENEKVTKARMREVDAMEKVLRRVSYNDDKGKKEDSDTSDTEDEEEESEPEEDGVAVVQKNQPTLAFLQQLSIPDNDWDGEGLRTKEGVPFGKDARFFWVYYLTCYCLLLNEPHPRRRTLDPRTDRWGIKKALRLNYEPSPQGLYNGVESPQPLVHNPDKLDHTLYHLQYWFDQHLADSPVTKLAYGISELCGLRKAAGNPALLLYDTDRDGLPQMYYDNARVRRQILRKESGEAGEEVPCPEGLKTPDGDAAICRMESLDEAIARRSKLVDLLNVDPDDLNSREYHDPHNRDRLRDLRKRYFSDFRRMYPRFLFVFDDEKTWVDMKARNSSGRLLYSSRMKHHWDDDERYTPLLHDQMWTPSWGRMVLRASDKAATYVSDEVFKELLQTSMLPPVAVDLYKPLPARYASYNAGYPQFAWDPSKAGAFYQAQKQFWEACNAHPRYVFAQQLRTYYFDPYLASPERLVADLTYWHYRKLEAIATEQSDISFDEAEARQYNLPDYAENLNAFYTQGRLERLESDELTPYTTKLTLEVDDYHARRDPNARPRRYFLRPFNIPLEVENEQGGREMAWVDDEVRAWTEFQVGKWYRDAEYHATMYERQMRGDAPVPVIVEGNELGYDFARYTTKDKGARERAESERLYDLRRAREREEYERDLRKYGSEPVRCTPFDNIGVAQSGMADAEQQEDPDMSYERALQYHGDYGSDDDESFPPFKYKGKTYTFFDDDPEELSYEERQLIKKSFPEAGVTVFGDVAYEKALREALEAKRQMLEYERIAPIYTPSTPPPPILDKEFWDELDREKRSYEQERRAQAAAARELSRKERRPRPYGESVVDALFTELSL